MKWLLTYFVCGLPMMAMASTYEERAVASVLMGEAWSEGARGMTAVGEVIHQRAIDKKQAPLDVISNHTGRVHSFSCLNGTTLDKLIEKFSIQPDYQRALRIAEKVCESPSDLPGLTNSADHYTRVQERPYWARGHHPVAIIGSHAFYKLKQY